MFTWDCPKCGKELDIATTVCPQCGYTEGAPAEAPSPRRAAPPAAPVPPVSAQAPETPTLPPPATHTPAPPPRHALSVPTKPLAIITLLLVAAIAGFLYYQHSDRLSGRLALENVDDSPLEMQDATGEPVSALEVVGIRTWYDDERKPKVRAVVVNHSDEGLEKVGLSVQLRPREANRNAPPLASFEVRLDEKLGPRESKEIETDLAAFGTLASLPHWSKVRVDIAPL